MDADIAMRQVVVQFTDIFQATIIIENVILFAPEVCVSEETIMGS